MLLFTGCSASKELTIKNKKLSEEEMDELQSAEGFNGVYFEFGGEIPENHIVNITLEQYEKGEFVAERALMPMEGSFEDNREIQFGSVLNSHEDDHEATLILETPGGGFTAPIGEIEGAFSWSEMIDKKVEIELNEPTF